MSASLVIQSHKSPLPYPWVERCLASVRNWCVQHQYEYRFIGDELFDGVDKDILKKTKDQTVIATDLARLLVLRDALKENYQTVVWLDADVLIFKPKEFVLPDAPHAVGREVWVQQDQDNSAKLKVYKKVHNAFLMFRQGNSFMDYYADIAKSLLEQNQGPMVAQFIGPKLLTALHNVTTLPVLETAGMLSPLVIKDMLKGSGSALKLFTAQSPEPIAAANLCISSCSSGEVSAKDMEQLIEILLDNKIQL